jgi:secretion/DNA translocation related TadE-like protein
VRSEHGAAAVIVVMVAMTILLVVGTMLGFVAGVFRAHRQAQSAADLTALAGAQTLVLGGDACRAAANFASANGSRLDRCHVVDRDVLVSVRVDGPGWWGFAADPVAEARAGAR